MRGIRGLAAALVVGAAAAGCGGSDAWPKTAGQTSCAEWLDQMTPDQRKGLALGMLSVLWERDGAASTPGDTVTLRFADAIGGVCASWRTETVSSVGSSLYVLSSDVRPGSD